MSKKSVFLAAALGCIVAAPLGAAESPKSDPVIEEIKTVLRQHDEAVNKQDFKAVMGFYADNPDVALMGAGPADFWKGKVAIEESYKAFFKDFKAGSLKHECPDASGGHDGNIAWLVASCNMQDATSDGQTRDYVLNISGVMKKEKGAWRIQTLHFATLTGDDMPPPEDDGAPAAESEEPAATVTPAAPPKTR